MGGTGGTQNQGDVGINWHVMDGMDGIGDGFQNYVNVADLMVGNGVGKLR